MSPWTPNDAVRLRTFLHQTPNFLERLKSKLTKTTGDTNEKRGITASERAGGENLIEEIEKMKLTPIAGDKAAAIHEEEPA